MAERRIVISQKTLFGKPHIKGTRISVEQVLGCLAEGWDHDRIMKEFGITEEDIRASIEFAHQYVSRTHVSGNIHA